MISHLVLENGHHLHQLKNISLLTFNEIIRNCEYVLLPYFDFPHMSPVISTILKEDDRILDETELLRLLGNLGYISQDKFTRIATIIDGNDHQDFEKVFKETNYLKQVKSKAPITLNVSEGEGPLLYQK